MAPVAMLLSLLQLLLKAVAGAVLACILYLVSNPINRWKYRHIPGAPYRAILGNLPEFKQYGSHEFMAACREKYGPVFKLWFGHRVWVVVCDPQLGKRVNYKLLNRPRHLGDPLMTGPVTLDENKGLFFSRDDYWRSLHRMWQPTFYVDSVHACAALMSGTTQKLVQRLEGVAAAAQPVDIWREIGKLTMAIVGTAAYGIDFHTIEETAKGAPQQPPAAAAATDMDQLSIGAQLVASAQTLFAAAGAASGSIYQLMALLLPASFRPAIAQLAHMFPDQQFRQVLKARRTLFTSSTQLVRNTKQKQQEEQENGGKSGAGAVKARRTGAIAPGSFLGLLLDARDAAGQGLTEMQLSMQANTFTLAGYETTANALAFALFCVSTHPEAEGKILQEAAAAQQPFHSYKDLEQQFPYTCAVVSEALRLYPPGASTVREVPAGGMQLGQYHVAEGSAVFVASYVMHRDPELWPRAGEFVPERWLPGHEHLATKEPAAYLPFGSGGRMCIGYRFALQEVRLGLLELLSKFHFEVQWELMVPPGGTPEVPAGDSRRQQQQDEAPVHCRRTLRTSNTFTLSPVGGIWTKVEPRAPVVGGRYL